VSVQRVQSERDACMMQRVRVKAHAKRAGQAGEVLLHGRYQDSCERSG